MRGQLLKPSELKSLLKFEGTKDYKFKCFLRDGSITRTVLLEDISTKHDALGKVVTVSNEGEFCHWPGIRHENLMSLLNVISLDNTTVVFVYPREKSLRLVIEETSFNQHPKCFDRKKSYVRGVVCGLKYLHEKSLALMNLNDEHVLICSRTDKALISDFSCITSAYTLTKEAFPLLQDKLHPPEFTEFENCATLECKPVDMWCCGVMSLQLFTNHVLPWCDLPSHLLNGLEMDLLKQTNIGACLPEDTARSLRHFLLPFLHGNPQLRIRSEEAAELSFLHPTNARLDEPARDFWRAQETMEPISDNSERRNKDLSQVSEFSMSTAERKYFKIGPPFKPLRNAHLSNSTSRKAKSDLQVTNNAETKIPSHHNASFQNSSCKITSSLSNITGSTFSLSNLIDQSVTSHWYTEPAFDDPHCRSKILNFKSTNETGLQMGSKDDSSKKETKFQSSFSSADISVASLQANGKSPGTNSMKTNYSKISLLHSGYRNLIPVIEHDTHAISSGHIEERDILLPTSSPQIASSGISEIEKPSVPRYPHTPQGGFLHSSWKTVKIKGVSGQSKRNRFKIKRCSKLGNQFAYKQAAAASRTTSEDIDKYPSDHSENIGNGLAFDDDEYHTCVKDKRSMQVNAKMLEDNPDKRNFDKDIRQQTEEKECEDIYGFSSETSFYEDSGTFYLINREPKKKSWLRWLCPGSKSKRTSS